MQDRFIETVYSFDPSLILHGGTAIWRCYSGNRFSFDIDGYITSKKEFDLLNGNISWEMAKRGMRLRTMRTTTSGQKSAIFLYITVDPTTDISK